MRRLRLGTGESRRGRMRDSEFMRWEGEETEKERRKKKRTHVTESYLHIASKRNMIS